MRTRQGKKAAIAWLLFGMAACNQIGGIEDGSLRECFTVDDCVVAVPECRVAKACEETRCIFENAPYGTPAEQETGDCAEIVCDGAGTTKRVPTPADVPDDGDPCTWDECVGMTRVHRKMTELPCYTGPTQTRKVGMCADGIQYCDDAGNPTSECQGEILPRAETCVYSLDEDCDGQSNEEGEACICIPGESTACYTGPAGTLNIGICQKGSRACSPDGLGYGPCVGEQTPQQEVCDALALDEDCDGQSDEGGICFCGDGIISAGENCDDGNANDGDACPSDCYFTLMLVAAGGPNTCVVFDDVYLKCWGWGGAGALGLGNPYARGDNPGEMGSQLPRVKLGMSQGIKAIAAGGGHVCAILIDDSVKCWGWNANGQLGLGDTQSRGDELNEMGSHLPAVDLGTGKTATVIALGYAHTCAILNDGSVKCWGYNYFGTLGLGNTLNRGAGPNEMGDNLPVVNLGTGKTAKAISAGDFHTCALLDDNSVKCWGYNHDGQLGLGDSYARGDGQNEMGDGLPAVSLGAGKTATAITAGWTHTCAILDDNSVKCWGHNGHGQLGLGDSYARGDGQNEMGDGLPAVSLGAGKTATAITAGEAHTCAILNDGGVKCWGVNSNGELGLGDTQNRGDTPNEMGDSLPAVHLGTAKTAKALSSGKAHTCVILDGDLVKCWGSNQYGALGLGDTHDRGDDANEMGDDLPLVMLW